MGTTPYLTEDEERRFVLRLLEYWQVVRGDRELPRLRDFNFNDMGKDASSCALIRLDGPNPSAGIFERLGLRLRPDGWGNDLGMVRRVADSPSGSLLAELVAEVDVVLLRRAPVSTANNFMLWGRPVIGRRILLPLTNNGGEITHILGGINFSFTDRQSANGVPL